MWTFKPGYLAAVSVIAVLVWGCGSDPSFTEVRTDHPVDPSTQTVKSAGDQSSADATAAGSSDGGGSHNVGAAGNADGMNNASTGATGNGTGAGNTANGVDSGKSIADAAGNGADTSKTDAGGGAKDGSGAGAGDGTGTGATTTTDNTMPTVPGYTPGTPGDKVLVEDGGTLVLPGEKVAKVGINFEDLPHGDFDFNDAVLCFTGAFKVDGSDVTSYKKQKITATTFSASGCSHRIDVKITNPDGTFTAFSYSSRAMAPIEMEFDVMSKLEVTMTPITNTQSCSNGTTSMHDVTYARVLLDQCNTSGN